MEANPTSTETRPPTGWRLWLRTTENLGVVVALGIMVLLPCLEILLRTFAKTGIPASAPLVQHLVLIVGMLGGALAARDGRLLALSSLSPFLRGRWQSFARITSHGFAAGVTTVLLTASLTFALSTRVRGRELAYGIPVWVVQLVLGLGFFLVAARLLWRAGETWRGRLLAVALAGAVLAVGQVSPDLASQLRIPALLALLAATLLGAPVFTVLGGAAVILLWSSGETVAALPLKHYQLTTNPTLPSIPLFTLAGYLLAEGGAARRFVRLFDAWFGSVRGGPALITVCVCAFFTSFTGASGVTILALGGLLMPVLIGAGYRERTSLGLLTSAGSLGLLFPPCLPPILYSIVASNSSPSSVSMEQVFLGGLLPGLLLMALTFGYGVWVAPARPADRPPFNARDAFRALNDAKWELLIPIVALVALFGGFASPVEAAALTAAYAFITEVFIYRDLRLFRDVPRVVTECGLLVGGVLLILGVALGFTHYLIDAQIPDQGVTWVTGTIQSKLLFLFVLNLFLLVVGCLMDVFSAIVVVVPLLVPVANAFGIHPVHLGIIFLANLELGYLTPPVGMNLFLSSYRFGKPMGEIARSVLPMLFLLFLGVLLITYVPPLTTWLPERFP